MIIDFAKTLVRDDDEVEIWQDRIDKINNKLCDKYYDSRDNQMLQVGSIGRGTAITKTSDYDVIFKLPREVYNRFDSHENNGQSKLLQEVKEEIRKLYSSTNIKGDGQVVVISFTDGRIELVPGFEQTDGSFKFPDSHGDGSWKTTKPIPEIEKSREMKNQTNGIFNYLCYLMRQWKNHIVFSFKGLLIDTMVCDYLDENDDFRDKSEFDLLKDLFEFLAKQDKERVCWLALGSNQKITNDDGGKFITKAKKALKKFDDEDEEKVLRELFGYKKKETKAASEQFIEDLGYKVDIRYNLKLDCDVSQPGMLTRKLSDFLSSHWKILGGRRLRFYVANARQFYDLGLNVEYYWKVRNVGAEAKRRNCERGQIKRGDKTHEEPTSFNGNHYVECYAVVDDVVVARGRIDVPIDVVKGM